MPRINNQDFLTLPQQVGKNKRDIVNLDANVQNISETLSKVVMGELVIALLNPTVPINIANYGITTLPAGVQGAVLDFIKQNHSLVEFKAPLMAKFDVAGGIVPEVLNPTEYNTLFSSTTYNLVSGDNYLFRAVGYSQNVRFELYAEYSKVLDVFALTSSPYVAMVSTVSNNTYYTANANIAGLQVTLTNLIPSISVVPCKVGDMIIAGSGIYAITSIVGTVANLTLQSGFVAPTGALGLYSYSVTSLTSNEEQKKELNKLLATKIFNVDGITGMSLEEQVLAQGMTLVVGTYLTYQTIGGSINTATYVSHVQGMMSISLINNTGSTISTNYTSLANTDLVRARGYLLSEVQTDVLGSMPITNWEATKRGLYIFSQFNSARTIPAGKQLNWQIFW